MVFETQIIDQREVAKNTLELTFKRPENFTFMSGQYAQVAVPALIKPDSKGRSRLFSIASSPADVEHLRVVFRATGSGFKETLRTASPGSIIQIEKAEGNFLLSTRHNSHQVFLAGGVGIAPFIGFLQESVHEVWKYPITLFYGNQSPASAAYLHELKSMAEIQPHFVLHELYQQPSPEMFAQLADKYPNAVWSVVGPSVMVDTALAGLRLAGISFQQIVTESFTGY